MAQKTWQVNLNLNKNELLNAVIQNLGTTPSSPKEGQIWFNTTDHYLYVYANSQAVKIGYLQIASADVLGGVKIGSNINVTEAGVISVADASTSTKGVIEIATDTEAATGTAETLAVNPKQLATKLTANSAITGATHTKITYDSKGLVTAGADITLSDVTDVTASASEVNILDGATLTTSELNTLDGITATTSELNQLHGSDVSTADFTKLHDITATAAEINTLDGITATTAELNILDGVTADATEINVLDGITATTSELNQLHDSSVTTSDLTKLHEVTATSTELNVLDGITASTAELNILDGVTADATELNVLDGITATTTELNYVDGVTSSIQTQLDGKVTANTAITGATKCKITYDSKGLVTSGADLEASDIPSLSLSKISDVTASASELNVLDGITATTEELNILDGVTATASELNVLDGITASTAELNILDGVTVTASDINSVTSKIGLTDLSIASNSTDYLTYNSANGQFSANVDTAVTADSTNLITSGAVKTAINSAITGGVHYAGTWDITSATDFSGITLPQTKGAMFYVTGTGPKTIGGIEWNSGDYLLVNDDVASGGSLVGKVDKIDNTESADIVRTSATQTLTNKTIDADSNTILDLTTSNLKSGTLVTTIGPATGTGAATDTELATAKAIRTQLDTKQDKVTTATENNIATWNASGNTKDSNKSFTTTVAATGSTSDNKIPTESAVRTAITSAVSGIKFTATNPALTVTGGVCTWSITNTLADADVQCIVKEVSTGEEVEVSITYSASTITIKMNSDADISSGVYKAVIIG